MVSVISLVLSVELGIYLGKSLNIYPQPKTYSDRIEDYSFGSSRQASPDDLYGHRAALGVGHPGVFGHEMTTIEQLAQLGAQMGQRTAVTAAVEAFSPPADLLANKRFRSIDERRRKEALAGLTEASKDAIIAAAKAIEAAREKALQEGHVGITDIGNIRV